MYEVYALGFDPILTRQYLRELVGLSRIRLPLASPTESAHRDLRV